MYVYVGHARRINLSNHLCILAMSIPNQLTSAKYTSFRHFDFLKFIFMFKAIIATVLPAKSDSGVKFCLQSYQGVIIDISLVY